VKALVFRGPHAMPVEDRPEPDVGPADVLVSVRASGICGSDVHGYVGATGRRRIGVVMGHEAAGEVIAVGADVRSVQAGDPVALRSILSCGRCDRCVAGAPNLCRHRQGLGMHLDGAYAERVVVPEALVARLPHGVPWDEAALIEPTAVALHAVALTPFAPGVRVAVIGAGPIGLLALLAARQRGAGTIVVTDRDPHRLDLARSLGADVAVDVSGTDGETALAELAGTADAVLEAVGISATVAQSIRLARPGGHVTWIGNSAPEVELPMQALVTAEITVRGAYGFVDEFAEAMDAIASRRIDVRPLVELTAPLADGPALFERLAAGDLPAAKVVLHPASG
jgi:L-iditol 2-dehydrogenase